MPVIYQPKIAHDRPAPKRRNARVVWLDRATRARRRAMLARSVDAITAELATVHLHKTDRSTSLHASSLAIDDGRVSTVLCHADTTRQAVNELCAKLGQVDLLPNGPLYDLQSLESALPEDVLPDITEQLLRFLDGVSATVKTTSCATTELIASVAAFSTRYERFKFEDNNEPACVCPRDVFLPPSDFDSSTDDSDTDTDTDESAGSNPDDTGDAESDSGSSSSDMDVDYYVEQRAFKRSYGYRGYDTSESEFESEVEAPREKVHYENRSHARATARKARSYHPFARPSSPSGSETSASSHSSWSHKSSASLRFQKLV